MSTGKFDRLLAKYGATIEDVEKENKADLMVACAMIASVCNVRLGRIVKPESYEEYNGVPSDFPAEEFLADYED